MSRPQLIVVVDTEEEFDWDEPFSRDSTATTAIAAQGEAHAIFDRYGIVPTYVVDYPVATDDEAVSILSGLLREGRAEIGAHLHPWVTPPFDEDVTVRNSYHCNLPAAVERSKIEQITRTIEQAFGLRPTIFKAGRYGFGPNTRRVLIDLGYKVDCSYVPFTSFASDGGPSFYGTRPEPFWLDREKTLLEVPLTSGYVGAWARYGRRVQWLFDNPVAHAVKLTGLLSRLNLLGRARLTPEGVSAAEQCRLLDTLVAQGQRLFTLSYHSPSLAPGHTPYVRDAADLRAFLATIDDVLRHFRDVIGGEFTTLGRFSAEMRGRREPLRLRESVHA